MAIANTRESTAGDVPQIGEVPFATPRTTTPAWLRRLVPVLAAALTLVGIGLALDGRPASITAVKPFIGLVTSSALVAVTISLLRMPALGHRERAAWRLMRLAFVVFWLSAAANLLARFVPAFDPDAIGQFAILAGFGLMTFALFKFPSAPRGGLTRARFVFDSATVFAAVGLFVWHFSVAPGLAERTMTVWIAVLVLVIVGLISVLVVSTALLLLRERTPGTRRALVRLVAGNVLIFALLVVALALYAGEASEPTLWATVMGWCASLLWIAAAVCQRDMTEAAPARPSNDLLPTQVLPYVLVALVFGFLLVQGAKQGTNELRGLLIGAAVVGVTVLVRQGLLLRENQQLQALLHEQATRDPLTGLLNRRAWDEAASREQARAERYAGPTSVIVFDVDEFKRINDGHGHAVGDEVLIAVGNCLRDSIRAADVPGRLGGDEFAVLLPETGLEDAGHLAEALCVRVRRTCVDAGAPGINLTISIGVADMASSGSVHELLVRADSAMYEAKRAGRNQVRSASAAVVRLPHSVQLDLG